MNRKNLTSAVLAGLAGVAGIAASAQAVNINPDGLGQVLIYPYYTTRGGNTTLVSVVNTTENAKAVKVRFMEGQNTREVLDFNLYMSAYDVWTAALLDGSVVDVDCNIDSQLPNFAGDGTITGEGGGQCGVPHLLTRDTSCTVPYLFKEASTAAGLQSFLPYRFDDGGDTAIDRAAEGHFEMIEMGTLVDTDKGSAKAATHGANGEPANCQQLVDAWTVSGTDPVDNYWLEPAGNNPELTDIEAPSGGLFGGASIINVADGFMVSYDAKAINGFASTEAPNGDPLHAVPGSVEPGLNSGDGIDATVFLDDGTTLASSGLTRGVDAVSFVFMHDQLMNQYSTETDIAGFTEWVITFPTKHFYVFEDDAGPGVPLAPFTEEWDPVNTDGACEIVVLEGIYDREEASPTDPDRPAGPPIVSPRPPSIAPPPEPTFELCYETNVIRFGPPLAIPAVEGAEAQTEIFGAKNFTNFDNESLGFGAGWVQIELDEYTDAVGDPQDRMPLGGLEGLPVTGFAAQKFGNLNIEGGVAAFYGGIYQHKGTRKAASS